MEAQTFHFWLKHDTTTRVSCSIAASDEVDVIKGVEYVRFDVVVKANPTHNKFLDGCNEYEIRRQYNQKQGIVVSIGLSADDGGNDGAIVSQSIPWR